MSISLFSVLDMQLWVSNSSQNEQEIITKSNIMKNIEASCNSRLYQQVQSLSFWLLYDGLVQKKMWTKMSSVFYTTLGIVRLISVERALHCEGMVVWNLSWKRLSLITKTLGQKYLKLWWIGICHVLVKTITCKHTNKSNSCVTSVLTKITLTLQIIYFLP